MRILLMGNPNVGKSAVFSRLPELRSLSQITAEQLWNLQKAPLFLGQVRLQKS